MYVVVVTFEVDRDHAVEFLEAVTLQAKNSLELEEQCHVFDVCCTPEDPGSVLLYEHYDDRAAFEEHLESDHFRDFDAKVAPWLRSKTVSTWQLQETGL